MHLGLQSRLLGMCAVRPLFCVVKSLNSPLFFVFFSLLVLAFLLFVCLISADQHCPKLLCSGGKAASGSCPSAGRDDQPLRTNQIVKHSHLTARWYLAPWVSSGPCGCASAYKLHWAAFWTPAFHTAPLPLSNSCTCRLTEVCNGGTERGLLGAHDRGTEIDSLGSCNRTEIG